MGRLQLLADPGQRGIEAEPRLDGDLHQIEGVGEAFTDGPLAMPDAPPYEDRRQIEAEHHQEAQQQQRRARADADQRHLYREAAGVQREAEDTDQ